jgi:hypothetical protein
MLLPLFPFIRRYGRLNWLAKMSYKRQRSIYYKHSIIEFVFEKVLNAIIVVINISLFLVDFLVNE